MITYLNLHVEQPNSFFSLTAKVNKILMNFIISDRLMVHATANKRSLSIMCQALSWHLFCLRVCARQLLCVKFYSSTGITMKDASSKNSQTPPLHLSYLISTKVEIKSLARNLFDLVMPLFQKGFSSVQSLSRVWLSDPMNRSTPGLPVHHQLPEFTQTHVHRVGDAIQPSHPLSSPSPPAPSPSQHQSLFQWVNSSHEVAKVLEFQL